MKIIRTQDGTVFGPFNHIETFEDHYLADGIVYFFESINPATVEEQGAWQPPLIPPVVPIAISPRQIRQALTAIHLRSAVESAVAAGNQDLKDWWEFATEFERNHPMVIGMALQLGVSTSDLDNLWILGGSL